MKSNLFKNIIALVLLFSLYCCNNDDNYISPIRKDIEPVKLVKLLREDSLMYAFRGYGVRPRDELTGIYLVSREKEKGLYHWISYNPKGTEYSMFYNSYINDDSILVKLSKTDSLEILNKARELIGICKRLELRWAVWEFGNFNCYFNDSTRMTFVENRNELDSNFYRFYKNLNWIDSNYVTYY
jgi:hypothetical protein